MVYTSVAVVGPMYSGKTSVREVFESELGYRGISHSQILKRFLDQRGLPIERYFFAMIDRELREANGSIAVPELVMKELGSSEYFAVDGIRHSDEIEWYRDNVPGMFVIGVDADLDRMISRWIRYCRMKADPKYRDLEWPVFMNRDDYEWASEQYDVGRALQLADVKLIGHVTKEELKADVRKLIKTYEFARAVRV